MSTETIQLSTPLKFLVVDDSRAIQAIVRRAISHCGYAPIEIETALDGEQALDIIPKFHPDLVITDWHMPKVSGLEMVQALRQMGLQKVRVGFVTTEKTPALLDQAISNGAMFIIHKPFNDAELVAAVTSAVKDIVDVAKAPQAAAAPIETPTQAIAPKSGEALVSVASLQQCLTQSLGNIPFRVIPNEKMTTQMLTPSNLLGLYSATAHKGVYAVGVMEANAICMVGGGAARISPLQVRAAMAADKPDEQMLAKAHEFLRNAAQCLTETSGKPDVAVTLAKASIVKNNFAKLVEVLNQPEHRADFRLSIPGYGEGRVAFFQMIV